MRKMCYDKNLKEIFYVLANCKRMFDRETVVRGYPDILLII